MASFAEHEAAHQSFEMMVLEEYSKVIRFPETPFQWHEADQGSARHHSRFYYGQQNHQLWMSEEAVIAAPHVLLDTRRVVHSDGQTHSLSATQGVDSPDIDVQKDFRPLTGLFPLASKITRPQLLSDYYKADSSRVQLSWDGNLAKMTFTYDEEVDRPLRIDLWCHPDYNWFPVRMERYRHKDDQLFDSDWIVGTLEKSRDSVHIHAGICRYAQKVWVDGDNADAAPFMVVRFVVKAGEYGREIPEALFLPDLKRGTDRLLEVPSKDEIHTVNDGITQLLSAEAESESPKITILHLQHANAQEISETIERLYPERKPPIVVVNERTNSLLIRGDDATVREYRQLVEVLDADNSSSPQQSKPPGGTSSFGGGGFGGVRSARGAAGSSNTPAQSTTNNTVSPEEVPNDDTEQLKIFSLKFSNANDTLKIVQSLFGLPSVKVAADERTNSLIVSGDAASLSEIEAILLKLDSNETAASPSNPLAARNGGNAIAAPTPIAEFRQRLDALEQPVQQLAEQVRATEAKLGQDHTDSAKHRAELRALIRKAFAERQEIQRAELAEFTRRLQHMQQSIETRERIAEKIVDRRVEELLDPDATWEQGLPSSALAHETGNSNEVLRKNQAKRLAAEAPSTESGQIRPGEVINAQQAKQLDISWDVFDDHPDTILADIDNLRSTGSNLLRSPNLDATEKNGLVFESVAAAADRTSPPKSDAEKAIARMVLVFFQDEARRAVPGLMIDHGTETLVLTGGSASIVPMGVGHAIDRSFIEIPGEPDVEAEFFVTKTADLRFHRAKPGLTKFKLEQAIDLAIGDSLSAIILSGKPTLRVKPNATRISALDQATSFSLDTHKFRHEFSGLVQIDQRLPEGTPLFKDGQLAGITLLGTRFMKDDVPGSYVVPASRIVDVLETMKTK